MGEVAASPPVIREAGGGWPAKQAPIGAADTASSAEECPSACAAARLAPVSGVGLTGQLGGRDVANTVSGERVPDVGDLLGCGWPGAAGAEVRPRQLCMGIKARTQRCQEADTATVAGVTVLRVDEGEAGDISWNPSPAPRRI